VILDINPNSIFIFMDEYDRRSFTDYLDFYDDGSELDYSYYPYFLAQQIYQTPTGQQGEDGPTVIHPFQTVYEEPFITSGNELMYVR
jgi:hypothetical protein